MASGSRSFCPSGKNPFSNGLSTYFSRGSGNGGRRITSTANGSITSVQAIYVPADDLTDPAPATTFSHLILSLFFHADYSSRDFTRQWNTNTISSRALDPLIVGKGIGTWLKKQKNHCPLFRITRYHRHSLGMEELSEEDKLVVNRARKLQRFSLNLLPRKVLPVSGVFVPLQETLRGIETIINGQSDEWPEQAFYMVGTIDQAEAKARELLKK